MKKTPYILVTVIIFFSCANSKKNILESGSEYWSESVAGDTTTLRHVYDIYSQGNDTLLRLTNYYENGNLKSKVIMKNELLLEIELVLDTLGNKLDFGQLKNGNGYVVQYRDDGIGRDEEGLYSNGNREGWWKKYHFSGSVMDSTLYKEGFPQYPPPTNSLDSLLELFSPLKNNLYK